MSGFEEVGKELLNRAQGDPGLAAEYLDLLEQALRQKAYVRYWEPHEEQKKFWEQLTPEQDTWLILGGEGCLGEGTLVSTPGGPRPIQDLNFGDFVYASDGTAVPVLRKFVNGERSLWRWYGKKWQRELQFDATLEHKVLYATQKDYVPRLLPLDNIGQRSYFVLSDGCALGNRPQSLALLIGLLLGDGCIRGKQTTWTCAEPELVEEVRPYAKMCGLDIRSWQIQHRLCSLLRPVLKRDRTTGHINGAVSQDPLVAELRRLGLWGCKSADKFIPSDVWQWSKGDVANLLGGLIATDGSVFLSHGYLRMTYTSCSRRLIEGIADLLSRGFGVYGSTICRGNKGTWTLSYANPQAVERIANLPIPGRKGKLLQKLIPHKIYDRGSYMPIVDREYLGELPTYDLMIDHPSHVFQLHNGVQVSNSGKSDCGAFLAAAWMLGKEYFRDERNWRWVEPLPIPEPPSCVRGVGLNSDMLRNPIWAKLTGSTEHPPFFPETAVKHRNNQIFSASFHNGSEFNGKSADVDVKTHGGQTVDFDWLDEECSYEIFRMNQTRIRRGGKLLVTATPHDDVGSVAHPWIFDHIEKWRAGDKSLGVIFMATEKNPYLSPDYVRRQKERLRGMPDEQARLYGIPTRRSGSYYKQWKSEPPLWVPAHELPVNGFNAVMIDPAVTGTVGTVWANFDSRGKLAIYRTYKRKGLTVSQHAENILTENRGDPIRLWYCDPFMGRQKVPDSTARDQHKTVLQVWREAGLPRLQIPDINYDLCLARSHEYLKAAFDPTNPHPPMEVFDHLEDFKWEMERYVIDSVVQGPNRGETRDRPRKGRDGASTLLECFQYLAGLSLRARPVDRDRQPQVPGSQSYFGPTPGENLQQYAPKAWESVPW